MFLQDPAVNVEPNGSVSVDDDVYALIMFTGTNFGDLSLKHKVDLFANVHLSVGAKSLDPSLYGQPNPTNASSRYYAHSGYVDFNRCVCVCVCTCHDAVPCDDGDLSTWSGELRQCYGSYSQPSRCLGH